MTSLLARALRTGVPAVLLAAAAALGGSAIGDLAVATAEPREWDLEAYDLCMKQSTIADQYYREYICCVNTGGVWVTQKYPSGEPVAGTGHCVAPPANAATSPRTWPGRVPTQIFQPAAPSAVQQPGNIGIVTQTFEPAPVA
jgi:hypothetical protein